MMALLAALDAAGVTLTLDAAGQLRARGPKGALTDPLRAALREHRDALVARLRRRAFDADAGPRYAALWARLLDAWDGSPPPPHPALEAAIDVGDPDAFAVELAAFAAVALAPRQKGMIAA